MQIYKKGQGKYTRMVTFAAAVFITIVAAVALSAFLENYASPYVHFGVPAALIVVVGLLVLWVLNRPKPADFLIATEGEMKKVSWSSRKEIVGSTKVVIITTFILAVILFGVDMMFGSLFGLLGILGD